MWSNFEERNEISLVPYLEKLCLSENWDIDMESGKIIWFWLVLLAGSLFSFYSGIAFEVFCGIMISVDMVSEFQILYSDNSKWNVMAFVLLKLENAPTSSRFCSYMSVFVLLFLMIQARFIWGSVIEFENLYLLVSIRQELELFHFERIVTCTALKVLLLCITEFVDSIIQT